MRRSRNARCAELETLFNLLATVRELMEGSGSRAMLRRHDLLSLYSITVSDTGFSGPFRD